MTSDAPIMPSTGQRIQIVDALRGAALAGILLLHSIEHWDFARYPKTQPGWLESANTFTHHGGFFLFGGKAYAVFAMMFGISFCLILESWSRRGYNFQGRFLWRLTLLAGFGYLNGIVYCGDILMVIALLGMPLVFLDRLSSKALAWLSVILVLQLPSLWVVGRVLFETGYVFPEPLHWKIYGHLEDVFAGDSLGAVVKTNLGLGQYVRLLWTYESGRYTQMLGLFIWGLLLGRTRVLEDAAAGIRLAKKALLFGSIGFAVIFPLKQFLPLSALPEANRIPVDNLLYAYLNLTQLALWVGLFVLLFWETRLRKALLLLAPYGRMSLTNYVVQGLIGVPLFYGFGFGLYRYLGTFFSVQVGLLILVLQVALSHVWLSHFQYGPLEWLWRALTQRSFDVPMRKRPAPAVA